MMLQMEYATILMLIFRPGYTVLPQGNVWHLKLDSLYILALKGNPWFESSSLKGKVQSLIPPLCLHIRCPAMD